MLNITLRAPCVATVLYRSVPFLVPTQLNGCGRCSVVARGRRDGNSGFNKGRRSSKKSRPNAEETPAGAWWADGEQDVASTSQPAERQSVRQRQPLPRRERQARDDQDDGKGWWEDPREVNLQAYAPDELKEWQVKRLEQAFATGRKKIKVMELARELDLDRSYILYWMKEFSLRPAAERNAVVSARMAEVQEAEAKQKIQAAAEAAQKQVVQHPKGQEGFIPFFTRKEMGMTDPKKKRLSADVLRTLESIYNRTAFPSNEMIKGLWDLHRVNRETALQWFVARREQDGITSSEQKRRVKDELDFGSDKDIGPIGFDDNNMLVRLLGDAAPQPATPAEPRVVMVSKRELTMMRSVLPSPNKHKGRRMNEEMGIRSEDGMLQVGDVKYVQEPEVPVVNKWSAGWRHRRASKQPRVLPLALPDEEGADV